MRKLEALPGCVSAPWANRTSVCGIRVSIPFRTKGGTRKLCTPVRIPLASLQRVASALWLRFIWVSPTFGSRTEASYSSLCFPELVLFDYFSLPIGKFACGDEGGIFIFLGRAVYFCQEFVIKTWRKVWWTKPLLENVADFPGEPNLRSWMGSEEISVSKWVLKWQRICSVWFMIPKNPLQIMYCKK